MIVDIAAEDSELLERFYREVYLPEFAAQREPLEAWQAALAGDQPYQMFVRMIVEHDAIRGGITYELYPRSGCGFVTYMVIAPSRQAVAARCSKRSDRTWCSRRARRGNDPRLCGEWERLERFQRWGAASSTHATSSQHSGRGSSVIAGSR
jgi:hypothetical protein